MFRNLFLDSIETHPPLLDGNTFEPSVCDGFQFAGVMKIREVLEQEKGKRNRKRIRKHNEPSKRAQRERKKKSKLYSERSELK